MAIDGMEGGMEGGSVPPAAVHPTLAAGSSTPPAAQQQQGTLPSPAHTLLLPLGGQLSLQQVFGQQQYAISWLSALARLHQQQQAQQQPPPPPPR